MEDNCSIKHAYTKEIYIYIYTRTQSEVDNCNTNGNMCIITILRITEIHMHKKNT